MRRLIVWFLLLSNYSIAHAVGNIAPVEIVGIFVREYRMDIFISAPHMNPTGCGVATQLVLLADEYPTSKAMFAAAMGAHLSGRKISGWINGCHDDRGKLSAIHVESN